MYAPSGTPDRGLAGPPRGRGTGARDGVRFYPEPPPRPGGATLAVSSRRGRVLGGLIDLDMCFHEDGECGRSFRI
jgi:hypothetical protein